MCPANRTAWRVLCPTCQAPDRYGQRRPYSMSTPTTQTETRPDTSTHYQTPMPQTPLIEEMIAATGEVSHRPMTLADRSAARIGKSTVKPMTSIDTSSQDGLQHVAEHLQYQPTPNAKANDGWYGKEVDLVAWTAREVVSTKEYVNENGVMSVRARDCPKPLTMTVLEFADGSMIHSCSDYVFDSLLTIVEFAGQPTAARPIKVKLVKAGTSDKLFQVFPPRGTHAAEKAAAKGRK